MSRFKTKTTKIYSKVTCVNSVYSGGHKPRKLKIKKKNNLKTTKLKMLEIFID